MRSPGICRNAYNQVLCVEMHGLFQSAERGPLGSLRENETSELRVRSEGSLPGEGDRGAEGHCGASTGTCMSICWGESQQGRVSGEAQGRCL